MSIRCIDIDRSAGTDCAHARQNPATPDSRLGCAEDRDPTRGCSRRHGHVRLDTEQAAAAGGAAVSELTRAVAGASSDAAERRFAFAELHDFLAALAPGEFASAVRESPPAGTDPYTANYIAGMVETAAHRNRLPPPAWTDRVAPLAEPVFGTALTSLRLHLLTAAPPAFRRRNIFIDASIGARV